MPQYHHLARLPGCLLLRRSLSLCAALLAACGGGSASSDTPPLDASVAFAATDLDFPNPERGMTRGLGPLASVSDNQLAALSADGVRLAYAAPDNTVRASVLTDPLCNFFFNDTATTEIYPLSLHDALPISAIRPAGRCAPPRPAAPHADRKSTRLNSSHT